MQSILTEKNPDINLRNYLGNTALHHAIISEAPKIAKLYADYGADVNATNMFGQTPYMLAIKYEYENLVYALLKKGAEYKSVKPVTSELLISITEYNDASSRLLINRNNDINVADKNGRTPLMHTIILNIYDLFERLIQKGADLELRDREGLTALLIAAGLGRVKMTHFLLGNKAASNAADNAGATALMHAVQKGSTKTTDILITWNWDKLNQVDRKGHNVLRYAIKSKAPDTVALLLAHNVNVNLRDPDGEVPLVYAAEFDNVAVCRHLLVKMIKNGGSMDDVDVMGRTALMKAVSHNNTNIVSYLIEQQANLDIQNQQGNTAVNLAVLRDHGDALQYLIAAKANLDIADDDLDTPLLTAVKFDHSHPAEMLITAGASLDIRGVDNETALMHALKKILTISRLYYWINKPP